MPTFRKFKRGKGHEGGKVVAPPSKRAGTDIVATPEWNVQDCTDVIATPDEWVAGTDPVKPRDQKKLRKRDAGSPKVIHIHEKPPEKKS